MTQELFMLITAIILAIVAGWAIREDGNDLGPFFGIGLFAGFGSLVLFVSLGVSCALHLPSVWGSK